MIKLYIKNIFGILQVLFIILMITSCGSTKKIKYFQDIPDSGVLKTIAKSEYTEPKIQVDDILSIIVQTVDPEAALMINSGNLPASATTSAAGPSGYRVNKDGFVELPILGQVHAQGLTTSILTDTLQARATKYFKNPTVIVRFSNFKVSITGEVLRPGQYVMPNERVTLLDAIAMAGDLTIFGKRENVLLIRENPDGTKTPYRINLKNSDIMSEPYYYLRQNDLIYVEPRKAKSDATDAAQTKYVSIAGALLSVLLVLATRLK